MSSRRLRSGWRRSEGLLGREDEGREEADFTRHTDIVLCELAPSRDNHIPSNVGDIDPCIPSNIGPCFSILFERVEVPSLFACTGLLQLFSRSLPEILDASGSGGKNELG